MKVKIVCAYCKKVIRVEEWENGKEKISHGVCSPCKDKELKKIRLIKDNVSKAPKKRL